MPRRCNQRELSFCKQYVICGVASRAAREAGYSRTYATQASVELLKRPHIKAEIDKLNLFRAVMPKGIFVEKLERLAESARQLADEIQNSYITR